MINAQNKLIYKDDRWLVGWLCVYVEKRSKVGNKLAFCGAGGNG